MLKICFGAEKQQEKKTHPHLYLVEFFRKEAKNDGTLLSHMEYGRTVEVRISTSVQKVIVSVPCIKDKIKCKISFWHSLSIKYIPSKIFSFRKGKGHN